ncbi:MAG: DUF2341 domain-containing protein [Verrucomicrobia bacterium]|nr:DUF2341 domain-containing protein [Verrucomicrobiota bacterium]
MKPLAAVLRPALFPIATAFLLLASAPADVRSAPTLSDPRVDAYNVRVGTQTFAGLYHFTTNTLLLETADAIAGMGSDAIKFYLGSDYPRQYHYSLPPNVTNLLTLTRDDPSCHHVLDLPFRNYILWAYPFANPDGAWLDGYSSTEKAGDYRELYDLTCYLLTNYDNSGKTFYLGHWEGDGYLDVNNWSTNPSPVAVQGMIAWLNNRQQAIDDAKRATTFTNVNVFGYAEANRVRDAMLNPPGNNIRVINAVIPYVTNLDYLSYSSYDAQNLETTSLYATLDYIKTKLPAAKAGRVPGGRIWIGEYGWGGSLTPDQQEPLTRAYILQLLNWGQKDIPFFLFWEIYDNEINRNYCLIDSNNVATACYHLHQRFINQARLLTARFLQTNQRLPTSPEFVSLVTPLLSQPLPPPVPLAISNADAVLLSPSSAQVSGTLTQGLYGDDLAAVSVFWGRQDGGTAAGAWENRQLLGTNTSFNPAPFAAELTNLAPQTNYFYRFYAANAASSAWAPASAQFSTITLDPASFGCRLRLTFPGYNRPEPFTRFPALVNLGTNLPGFAYTQLAQPEGGDLRFTDASGLRTIPFEIDQWNTNGVSTVWVSLPVLAGPTNFIWAYWGNPAAVPVTAASSAAVWTPAFNLVWHLKESGFPYADSTLEHPALTGSPPTSTPGIIGRGVEFDGGSQFLDAGPVSLGDAFTLAAWLKLDPSATNTQAVWASKAAGLTSPGLAFYVNSHGTSDGAVRLETSDGTATQVASTGPNAVTPGQWHLITAVVDRTGGTARLLVDGADQTQGAAVQTNFPNTADMNLGRFTDGSCYFKGAMDEVRIERSLDSPNQVWAEWQTVAHNAAFSAGSEVNPPPALSVLWSAGASWLVWPYGAGVFSLYFTTNLASPAGWMPVTNPPTFLDGQWQALLAPAGAANGFYQLRSR